MLKIIKLRSDNVIDFAAEELKKYLRMMMPEEKQVDILYSPTATGDTPLRVTPLWSRCSAISTGTQRKK